MFGSRPWRRKTCVNLWVPKHFPKHLLILRLAGSRRRLVWWLCEPSSCFHIPACLPDCILWEPECWSIGHRVAETRPWNIIGINPTFFGPWCVRSFYLRKEGAVKVYCQRMWEFHNWKINQEIFNNSTLHESPNPRKEIGYFWSFILRNIHVINPASPSVRWWEERNMRRCKSGSFIAAIDRRWFLKPW